MKYNPDKHHRRSIRLKGYDYSQPGWYFITICAQNRECFFGEIVDEQMMLNDAGRVAEKCWNDIPFHFPHVELDAFVIMPNHVHGILLITGVHVVGAKNFSPLQPSPLQPSPLQPSPLPSCQYPRGTSKTIGSVIRGFKIGVTKWMRKNTGFYNIWQRNYYEHIIRDEQELNRIRKYIIENPLTWQDDGYYTDHHQKL